MDEKSRKPKIRFAGFTEDWEQRRFDKFVIFFSGLTYTPNDIRSSGTFVLRSSNVSDGEIVDADNVYVAPEVVNSEKVREGDIIIVVRNGSRTLIGKHAEIKTVMPNTVIGAFMTGIRSEYPSFVNALLSTSHFDNEVAMNMGATINQITGYMFSKMAFLIPSEAEQTQIGTFFRHLDHLITLHQRKRERLVNIKKAMLEKMFPKKGADVPEVRFAGFTEAWEQRKFDELADYKKGPFGSSLTKDMFIPKNDESVKVYEQQNAINKNWKLERYFISKEYATKMDSFAVKGGDIIVSCAGTIGEVYILPDDAEKGIINQALMRIQVHENIVNKILFLYLFSRMIDSFSKTHSHGSAMKNIPSFADLKPAQTNIPHKNEQDKITKFILAIDHLITLHQRKVELLQNIKKACLEMMFV